MLFVASFGLGVFCSLFPSSGKFHEAPTLGRHCASRLPFIYLIIIIIIIINNQLDASQNLKMVPAQT
jgi:hypothetical protein